MSLIDEFIIWLGENPKEKAKLLGARESVVERWLSGASTPPMPMVEKFYALKNKDAPAPEPAPKAKKAVAAKPVQQIAKTMVAEGIQKVEVRVNATEPVPEETPPEPSATAPNLTGEWEGRNLMVLFPCYRFTNAATAWTLVALALDFGKEKIRFEMQLGDAMIYHARNVLADKFLKSGCEWSLWIDDDIIPPIGRPDWFKWIGRLPPEYPKEAGMLHVVHRLMEAKKMIVGATYYGRHPGGPVMCADMHKPETVREARSFSNKVKETEWVATGCLLVHRQVYLDIQKKFPNLGPSEEHPWQKEFDFFLPEPGQGEDVAFCKRARAAGHQVFIDLGLQCLHVGYCSYHALNTGQANMGVGI